MKKWKSCARWPHEHGFQDDLTTDEHETQSAANAVCRKLEKEGLGGEGIHFPLETWIERKVP